jgi:carbamoyl-phosphate synthase small subunit
MAKLILEDGTVYHGKAFGACKDAIGEVVFNTGMTGYQEVLTDPSYFGQIVMMTYPLIGNYGVNDIDPESQGGPKAAGFIVRELCEMPNNWACEQSLDDYLKQYGITAICGIDTREITRKIRNKGTMNGIITTQDTSEIDYDILKTFVAERPVMQVTTQESYTIDGPGKHVAVIDFGVKGNILTSLKNRGCKLTVFPAETDADTILSSNPDGIFLSNGPGDPKDNVKPIETIKILAEKKPIFGICLGHQLLALAAGADTGKMKFGHRGCNHPVKDLKKDRTYITSQNHGYSIVNTSINESLLEITHLNLNDTTIEGLRYKDKPVFSVQFHPEACPGPQDTAYLFDEFMEMMER